MIPASRFPGGESELANAVREQKIWVAIAGMLNVQLLFQPGLDHTIAPIPVSPNATSRLTASYANPDRTYNGSQVATAYAVEARNENA